jgi:hypothetical protein
MGEYSGGSTHGIPVGGIIMWSGSIATIPGGWALCNGDNGTPDLRDRFVVGAKEDDSGTAKTTVSDGGTTLTQSGGEYRHRHGAATGTGDAAVHRDTEGDGNNAQGLSHVHSIAYDDHLPPYYALAFIQKL